MPIVPSLSGLAAVGAMSALGVWQLHRAAWKEALLSRYHASLTMSSDIAWPRDQSQVEGALYRHASIDCARVLSIGAISGRNAKGEAGWAHVARCAISGAGEGDVVLGWSSTPGDVEWTGGAVSGIVGPGKGGEARLIAAPPLAGLAANAAPDPQDIPNNHMSYAVQWFLFAATALIIYVLALRKRWKAQAGRR